MAGYRAVSAVSFMWTLVFMTCRRCRLRVWLCLGAHGLVEWVLVQIAVCRWVFPVWLSWRWSPHNGHRLLSALRGIFPGLSGSSCDADGTGPRHGRPVCLNLHHALSWSVEFWGLKGLELAAAVAWRCPGAAGRAEPTQAWGLPSQPLVHADDDGVHIQLPYASSVGYLSYASGGHHVRRRNSIDLSTCPVLGSGSIYNSIRRRPSYGYLMEGHRPGPAAWVIRPSPLRRASPSRPPVSAAFSQ